MYHSISNRREISGHPFYDICTAPHRFKQQMQGLLGDGHGVIPLAQVQRCIESDERPHDKPVVITFDDGYRDFLTEAFPTLARFGFTASVFLPTAYIGRTARTFKGRQCLTWAEVRELHRAGVEFGSHTVTHPQLRTMRIEQIEYELRRSKETIEDSLGGPVQSFAYPYAFPEEDSRFRNTLRQILQQNGYEHGVSTIIGAVKRGEDAFFMRRLPINNWDDSRLFRAKLAGGYDWVHTVQYAIKFVKARVLKRQPVDLSPQ